MIPPNAGKEVLPKEHLTKSIYSGTWTRMRKDEISVTITTRFDTPSPEFRYAKSLIASHILTNFIQGNEKRFRKTI